MSNAWAEIDLVSLQHNIAFIRRCVGENVSIMAIVKADAYGHGATEVVRSLLENNISWFGVANVSEGKRVRALSADCNILILGQLFTEHRADIVSARLTPIVCDIDMARALDDEAKASGIIIPIHVKIDTGMGRVGVWHEDVSEFMRDIKELTHLRAEGFLSHFPCSDEDIEYSLSQIAVFKAVTSADRRPNETLLHMANSAAILTIPESYFDMVRPGIIMYGLYPSTEFKKKYDIQPVLSLKSKVSFIKKTGPGRTISYGKTHVVENATTIATIPLGYGDGYNRLLSNKGRVLIRGEYAPLVGRVTMDQIMVDVGHIPEVRVGDEVVLIGRQGDNEITVEEIARITGTIPYEVVCGISKRVERVYSSNQCISQSELT